MLWISKQIHRSVAFAVFSGPAWTIENSQSTTKTGSAPIAATPTHHPESIEFLIGSQIHLWIW
jgi:hypothetical protein